MAELTESEKKKMAEDLARIEEAFKKLRLSREARKFAQSLVDENREKWG